MARSSTRPPAGTRVRVGALPEALLADPIAFLAAEHGRQRVLLGHLERLARQPASPARGAIARALAAWFACELPLHRADEETSLYPRLGPEVAPALALVRAEEAALDAVRRALRSDLAHMATGHRPAPGFAERATRFAAAYRRCMAEEEEGVFPVAQATLGAACRATIAREMAARRQ
jgi:hemerythrin-like domain-containing protein